MSAEQPSELSQFVDIRGITTEPVVLTADEAQRDALAERFAIVAVDRLEAEIVLERNGEEVAARGQISADIVQSCAVSGADLAMEIDESIELLFVPERAIEASEDEEIELTAAELDEIAYAGTSFDLGEAVAQSLALAIDPYAVGPNAEDARREHGLIDEEASGPLAEALAALKKD